jgi:RimJ/RimL family protein N-acetyltransferase
MAWLERVTLDGGQHVRLEPLGPEHHDALVEAVRDGELWRLWYTSAPSPEGMAAWIDAALAMRERDGALPFVVRERGSGRVLGSTRCFHVDPVNRRFEIGHTWMRASSQRSGANLEAKLALLRHAFETLDCIAVEFRTHFMNRQSRTAIEGLGARLDGILRAHQRTADGALRDTCVYSITAPEWPAVRNHLRWRLERPR